MTPLHTGGATTTLHSSDISRPTLLNNPTDPRPTDRLRTSTPRVHQTAAVTAAARIHRSIVRRSSPRVTLHCPPLIYSPLPIRPPRLAMHLAAPVVGRRPYATEQTASGPATNTRRAAAGTRATDTDSHRARGPTHTHTNNEPAYASVTSFMSLCFCLAWFRRPFYAAAPRSRTSKMRRDNGRSLVARIGCCCR